MRLYITLFALLLSAALYGQNDYSMSFDGVDDIVSVNDDDDWNFTNTAFTISTWFNIESIPLHSDGSPWHICLLSQREAQDKKWLLYLLNNEIYFGTKNGSWSECFVPWTPQINTWYNLACVQVAGNCDFYINGVLIGSYQNNLHLSNLNAFFMLPV